MLQMSDFVELRVFDRDARRPSLRGGHGLHLCR
jgi:hypothetical protein